MMAHRDLWEALGSKDKLAYPCPQELPTHSLSDPHTTHFLSLILYILSDEFEALSMYSSSS